VKRLSDWISLYTCLLILSILLVTMSCVFTWPDDFKIS
jgi:uncharacterized membrane protein YkgB